MKMNEMVCCIARKDIEDILGGTLPQGVFTGVGIERALALPQTFLPRRLAEIDPAFKQVIGYQLFQTGDRYFVYRRGGGVGEGRLAGRLSLGIGGHINDDDAGGGRLDLDSYQSALLREREEELLCPPGLKAGFIGWINDDSEPVGQVHLGAVHLCRVAEEADIRIRPMGEDLHAEGWWTPAIIRDAAHRFERWSLLALALAEGESCPRMTRDSAKVGI